MNVQPKTCISKTPEREWRKTSYRLCGAVAKQTGEAVGEEAEGREDVTQTPTLSANRHTRMVE